MDVGPAPYGDRMDMDDPQAVGAAFGAMMLGGMVSEGRPDPSTPLGRIDAFVAEHGANAVTQEHVAAAIEGRPLIP